MEREIGLTRGKVAIVDDADFERLSQWKWFCSPSGYAVRNQRSSEYTHYEKRQCIWMHRVIMDTPQGYDTDHINGNKLDNRRSNLRVCMHQQNAFNQPSRSGTSTYKGVRFRKHGSRGRWNAQITVGGKKIHIGYFNSEEEAARAYDSVACEYFGEFALLNFPVNSM